MGGFAGYIMACSWYDGWLSIWLDWETPRKLGKHTSGSVQTLSREATSWMWVVASTRLGAWITQSAELRAAHMCHTWVFSSRCFFAADTPMALDSRFFSLWTWIHTGDSPEKFQASIFGMGLYHVSFLFIYTSHLFLGITGDHVYPIENVQAVLWEKAGKDGVPLGLAQCKYPVTILQDITSS